MYFVIELQTNQDGTAGILTWTYPTKNEALSKYHNTLSFAAVSELPVHSAVVIDEQGRTVAREAFVRNMPEVSPEE